MPQKELPLILLLVLLVWGPSNVSQAVEGKIYWTDAGRDKIQCANLDGSNVQDLGTSPHRLGDPHGIALDVATGKIYWTDEGRDKIQCANLDGSNVQDLIYIRTYANLYPATKLIVQTPRMRNELRYYEPKGERKRPNCVSPKSETSHIFRRFS